MLVYPYQRVFAFLRLKIFLKHMIVNASWFVVLNSRRLFLRYPASLRNASNKALGSCHVLRKHASPQSSLMFGRSARAAACHCVGSSMTLSPIGIVARPWVTSLAINSSKPSVPRRASSLMTPTLT